MPILHERVIHLFHDARDMPGAVIILPFAF